MRSFTSERRAESSVPLLQKFVQTDAEAGFIARADVMTPDLPSYPIVVGVIGYPWCSNPMYGRHGSANTRRPCTI